MHNPTRYALSLLALATLLAACSKPADVPPAAAAAPKAPAVAAAEHTEIGIAWKYASNDAEVDAAFALAKAEAKPVFVYWGAKWCPPCNQVKATLFNRQDFIERSRAFVPVYVDGDSPGAQKIGARFKVSGYPTMLLFNPQGIELTRLPGEVDAQRYTEVLTLGMNAQRPVKDVLALVKAGGAGLTANDWRLLAFYSWDTDEKQVVPKDELPALMKQLAAACPADQTEVAMRLQLKALAAVDEKSPSRPDAAAQVRVVALLADAPAARAHMDVLATHATDITRALSAKGTPQRAELLGAFEAALKRFEADTTLSRADRLTALTSRVALARMDAAKGETAKLPDALVADARAHAERADSEITDGYERQAVIVSVAHLLTDVGLVAESDTLLKASLAKSHSPYYLMLGLASNAKKRGDKADALHWYEESFDKSEGPATRLQWGSGYVNALVDLSPQDEARIEKAAQQLFAEAGSMPDAFYERSGRSLQRVGTKLQGWNKGGAHAAVLKRLQAKLDAVCGGLPAGDTKRTNCEALLKPAPKKTV